MSLSARWAIPEVQSRTAPAPRAAAKRYGDKADDPSTDHARRSPKSRQRPCSKQSALEPKREPTNVRQSTLSPNINPRSPILITYEIDSAAPHRWLKILHGKRPNPASVLPTPQLEYEDSPLGLALQPALIEARSHEGAVVNIGEQRATSRI
jgi:hypothetical protein